MKNSSVESLELHVQISRASRMICRSLAELSIYGRTLQTDIKSFIICAH